MTCAYFAHDMTTIDNPTRNKNLRLLREIIEWGETLAREDHRDFSNEVEWLIECEWKRRLVTNGAGRDLSEAEEPK